LQKKETPLSPKEKRKGQSTKTTLLQQKRLCRQFFHPQIIPLLKGPPNPPSPSLKGKRGKKGKKRNQKRKRAAKENLSE